MNKIVIALACLLAVGCMPITKEKIQKEEVPVYVIPAPPVVDRPILETSKLTAEDRKDLNKVAKAMTIAKEELEEYADSLEKIVNKYRELSNTSKTIDQVNLNKLGPLNIDSLQKYLDTQHK